MEDVEKSPPVVVGVTDAKHIARRINVVRQQAGIEYITDPDGKSIRWHYDRPDRDYGEHVTWMTFDQWARTDKWVDRRVKFWQDIEARTLRLYRDELLKARLEEIREMTESRSFIFEHLQPLRNADGTVQRDDQGLPVFGPRIPSLDKLINAFIKLDTQVMLKRGEAISRTETIGGEEKRTTTALDPVAAMVSLGQDDLRTMARALLKAKQPELAGSIDGEESERQDGGE